MIVYKLLTYDNIIQNGDEYSIDSFTWHKFHIGENKYQPNGMESINDAAKRLSSTSIMRYPCNGLRLRRPMKRTPSMKISREMPKINTL